MKQQPCICLLSHMYVIFAIPQMFLDQRNGILVSSLIHILSAKHLLSISFELACDLTVNKTLDQRRVHFIASPLTHSFSF